MPVCIMKAYLVASYCVDMLCLSWHIIFPYCSNLFIPDMLQMFHVCHITVKIQHKTGNMQPFIGPLLWKVNCCKLLNTWQHLYQSSQIF